MKYTPTWFGRVPETMQWVNRENVTLTFYTNYTFEIKYHFYEHFDLSISQGRYASESEEINILYEGKYVRKGDKFHMLCETEKYS